MQTDDFLNPKSMITPGFAGSLTMGFTNILATQFSLASNITGLVISFMFGFVVCIKIDSSMWLRGFYWILNSFIIFTMALGANQAGVGVAAKSKGLVASIRPVYFSNWLDGTVSRRKELLSSIKKLNDSEAAFVLKHLKKQTVPS